MNIKPVRNSFNLRENYDIGKVELMKEIGPKHGVRITILAGEGETYPALTGFGKVPPGMTRVKITTEVKKINGFWNEVKNAEVSKEGSPGLTAESK